MNIRKNIDYGEYQAVLYNAAAQQFVLDHLPEMLAEK